MPSATFDPAKGELCIRLNGISETESFKVFLALGMYLSRLGDLPLACLGATIVEELTSKRHASLNAGAMPVTCTFCEIAKQKHIAAQDKGEPPRVCPF
jgi:hypothetical protein